MKRPSFQFYPGDWMRDSALRSCSVGARGLWMDMLCLMHEGTPYGYLKVNLKVILPPNLARIVGSTLPETEGWLSELEDAGVFSRDQDGAIFSRRMIRDESIRQSRACGGKLGGNPALKDNHKVGEKVADKVNLPANLQPTPSSSSSSSDKDIGGKPPSTPDASSPKHEEAIYEAYPRKVARKNALKAIAKALKSVPHDVLLEKTKAYAASVVGKDPNYIPHPATWFNGERYLDGTETQGGTSKPAPSQQPSKPMTEKQKRIAEIREKMAVHPGNPYVEFGEVGREATREELREYTRLQTEMDRIILGEAVAA